MLKKHVVRQCFGEKHDNLRRKIQERCGQRRAHSRQTLRLRQVGSPYFDNRRPGREGHGRVQQRQLLLQALKLLQTGGTAEKQVDDDLAG